METCIDDVLKTPVPALTAAEEAGPSSAYAAASVTAEDPLSLAGEAITTTKILYIKYKNPKNFAG